HPPAAKSAERKINPPRLPEIMNGDNVRMVQRSERLRLAREAFSKFRVADPFRRQQLECDGPIQSLLPRLIHPPHSATPETFNDFKLGKMRCDLFEWQWRLHRHGVARENGFRLQIQRHEAIRT